MSPRLENRNSRVVIDASLVDSGQQLGDVNAPESGENSRQNRVFGQGKHATETGLNATRLIENSSGKGSTQQGNKDWNVVACKKVVTILINSLITSNGQTCATNDSRWANMVEEKDEHVSPHEKLSPEAPTFVPKGSGIATISSPLNTG